MADTLDILRGARALLADRESWIHHGPAAVDREGEIVGVRDYEYEDEEGDALHPDACAWCLVGACQRAAGRRICFDDPEMAPLRTVLEEENPGDGYRLKGHGFSIGIWNDDPDRRHSEVLHVLDLAIALASRDTNAPEGE